MIDPRVGASPVPCHPCSPWFRFLIAPLVAVGLLASAGADPSVPGKERVRYDAPNPAALYCHLLGYDYEIIEEEAGQRGICVLPNGERVDAWEFFRGEVAQEYAYCAQQGCGIEAVQWASGSSIGRRAVCVGADGTISGAVAELMGLLGERGGGSGARSDPDDLHASVGEIPSLPDDDELPARFDWRDVGGCTPIRNQGPCGSCWAFGAIAILESAVLIKDGVLQDLSEQWLVSCNEEGWGCSGGSTTAHDYHLWKTDPCGPLGAVLEAHFPYNADELPCDCPYRHEYVIDDWGYVGDGHSVPSVADLKRAIHERGPIAVGVAADGAFASYLGGVFDDCTGTGLNHVVVLVGWDDAQGEDGVWFLRNSWGTAWGEEGYMRIQFGCNRVGYGATWIDYAGVEQIAIDVLRGVPEAVDPAEPTQLGVRIEEVRDDYVAGSGMLHYRVDEGDFTSRPLIPSTGGVYHTALPPASCGRAIDCYFSVEGVESGPIYSPARAPGQTYTSLVGTLTTILADDFETDMGWTVVNDEHLIAGAWERGVPIGGGDQGDPPADYDGSGSCYLTGNADGNSDVDLGTTWLISPPLDLGECENDEIRVSYAVWYTNRAGNDPHNDLFRVHVSNNDGTDWVEVEVIGPHSRFGWEEHSFMVGDFVELTDEVRVRFEASDLGDISIVEAGIDAFEVELLECQSSDAADGVVKEPRLRLEPVIPNPFSAGTTIRYRLPRTGPVSLGVYGIDGRLVRTLLDTRLHAAGQHRVEWDARDGLDCRVAVGVYYCRLTAEGTSLTRAMMVLR